MLTYTYNEKKGGFLLDEEQERPLADMDQFIPASDDMKEIVEDGHKYKMGIDFVVRGGIAYPEGCEDGSESWNSPGRIYLKKFLKELEPFVVDDVDRVIDNFIAKNPFPK